MMTCTHVHDVIELGRSFFSFKVLITACETSHKESVEVIQAI